MSTKSLLRVPYGLFVALGVYSLLVLLFVWLTYWRSPEYQAAEHFSDAQELLGLDDGRKASRPQLEEAFRHLLEAARLMPSVRLLHDRVESMRWRFEERHFKLEPDLVGRAEAVASVYQRIAQEQAPLLVVGARDRGWAPDQLLKGPTTLLLWSLPGAALIVLLWAWLRFSARAVRLKEHEEHLKQVEAEVAASERSKARAQPKRAPQLRGPGK